MLKNVIVVFAGSFKKARTELRYLAESRGAFVSVQVTEQTGLLVAGLSADESVKKARELGVEIIQEDEFCLRVDHSAPPPLVDELKMWLAVRTDITMPRGKLATQAGHGFCGALNVALADQPNRARAYLGSAAPKITVSVPNTEALDRVHKEALAAGIPVYLVIDAGRTVFEEPTKTVCAFGPCLRSELPSYLKRLRLLVDVVDQE